VRLLYRNHQYDLTLALARLGILPFFWIACWVVFGGPAAATAPPRACWRCFYSAFSRRSWRHGGLATTDMALTAFVGAAFCVGRWHGWTIPRPGAASSSVRVADWRSFPKFFQSAISAGLVCLHSGSVSAHRTAGQSGATVRRQSGPAVICWAVTDRALSHSDRFPVFPSEMCLSLGWTSIAGVRSLFQIGEGKIIIFAQKGGR